MNVQSVRREMASRRNRTRRQGGEYQGHKNRNAWNVALYIFNEEPLYRMAQEAVRWSARNNSGRRNLDDATTYMMTGLPARTPDGVPFTKTNVRLALQHWEG